MIEDGIKEQDFLADEPVIQDKITVLVFDNGPDHDYYENKPKIIEFIDDDQCECKDYCDCMDWWKSKEEKHKEAMKQWGKKKPEITVRYIIGIIDKKWNSKRERDYSLDNLSDYFQKINPYMRSNHFSIAHIKKIDFDKYVEKYKSEYDKIIEKEQEIEKQKQILKLKQEEDSINYEKRSLERRIKELEEKKKNHT
jgi:hypothetical protein